MAGKRGVLIYSQGEGPPDDVANHQHRSERLTGADRAWSAVSDLE